MRSLKVKQFLGLLLVVLLMASCASSNGMVRKCDGRQGQRVGMGVI